MVYCLILQENGFVHGIGATRVRSTLLNNVAFVPIHSVLNMQKETSVFIQQLVWFAKSMTK
jgi:hypothetical protein